MLAVGVAIETVDESRVAASQSPIRGDIAVSYEGSRARPLRPLKRALDVVGAAAGLLAEDAGIAGRHRHRRRLELVPGMTGPWQLLGPARASLEEMAAIDYRYVAEWSLRRDLAILLRTVPHVVGRRGL